MKYKEYHFEVEMIIDHSVQVIGKSKVDISTHRTFRGIRLNELLDLIRNEKVPQEENVKITFMIRGVNY